MSTVHASEASQATTGMVYPPPMQSVIDPPVHKKGLSRKLTCCVVAIVCTGVVIILALQVWLILTAVPDWGADAEQAMLDLELENIKRLASDKAGYATETFGRVKESMLQVQAFAEQVLLETPATMQVGSYVRSYAGLEQNNSTWEHSVWFIPTYDVGETPPVNSSLESLLDRSSLMDVQYRSMQRQHQLIYLAALDDDPSVPADEVPDINFQAYAGFDMAEAGYQTFTGECEDAFTENGSYIPTSYDPRCRVWYQDAVSSRDVVFTDPYTDATTLLLVVTVAAPVYHSSDGSLLGVAAIDIDISDIESSVLDLRVLDDEGYAYLLARGDEGYVTVHSDLDHSGNETTIVDLEVGLDEEDFGGLLTNITDNCSGSDTYTKDGDTWFLSWEHETATSLSEEEGGLGCAGGFVAVVTVAEDSLLEEFSAMESEVRRMVLLAILVMVAVLAVISCVTGCFARALSQSITDPVNQLVDVVRALNRMDFGRQAAGTWLVNEITSSEVEELVKAFQAMTTVVSFANMTLESGDIEVAEMNYIDALKLFTKLENGRGVAIVHNNLGNVYTLQARKLSEEAAVEKNPVKAGKLLEKADDKFNDAASSYQQAVDHAEMLYAGKKQEEDVSSPPGKGVAECKQSRGPRSSGSYSEADLENPQSTISDEDDLSSASALALQLANRKFNLALCLAAKGNSAVPAGRSPDLDAINDARRLMWECVGLAADRKDTKGDQRHVECLVAIATLELDLEDGHRATGEALDAAEGVIFGYLGAHSGGNSNGGGGFVSGSAPGAELPVPLAVLRQQVLAVRGKHCVAAGYPDRAIEYWTDALVGSGDRMDVNALRSCLNGIREEIEIGSARRFPEALLAALELPKDEGGYAPDVGTFLLAIDAAMAKLNMEADTHELVMSGGSAGTTDVDLCFVMDCTRSMQAWIDQAKNKMLDIIAQAKEDVANLNLRVAFVGYRDFGDKTPYEGPYDFHTEEELPSLLAKLAHIKASGGQDIPEDVAGGLHRAVDLSWRSPIRLFILVADAPCHGSVYHGCRDNYPKGCPQGLDPSKLLYTLQYELGVDFYFIRITSTTDKMISVLKNTVAGFTENRKHMKRPALRGTTNTDPKFVIHDLGSNNNRFLEAVVKSVKVSAGINLRVEDY